MSRLDDTLNLPILLNETNNTINQKCFSGYQGKPYILLMLYNVELNGAFTRPVEAEGRNEFEHLVRCFPAHYYQTLKKFF